MLLSDVLGEFHESFCWEILSSSQPLLLEFTGRVVGPSFVVDHDQLDYGIVSYGFRYFKSLTLHNTSKIPMRFTWRVENDLSGSPEFDIVPKTGMVLPKGKQTIEVEFTARTVSMYSKSLLLDIPGVGEGLLKVPITAECAVPRISLESDVLDFEECPIRYPCTRVFKLLNESKLPAKFEVLPQDNHSKSLATFTSDPCCGGISAQVYLYSTSTSSQAGKGSFCPECMKHQLLGDIG